MTNYCSCCGSPIPEGQRVCSMCYGDIDYGADGYYRQWAEEQERKRVEEDEQERRYWEKCELERLAKEEEQYQKKITRLKKN